MRLGMIGLGRMGGNMARRLRGGGIEVVGYNRNVTANFLAEDQGLANIEPFVADSGEGRWTAIEAIEQGIPTPVMSTALMMRFASQGQQDYTAKLLAMMRKGFGGRALKQRDQ